MATYTENYNLKKPDLSDIANIGDINDNMDIIDEEMSKLIDSVPTMSGASASTDGESGVVPQPVAGDNAKYLRGDATYSVPGVMTINGRTPDPVTGDITVIEGGGSGSYGSYRLDATIPVSAWSGSGPYTTTITNEYIKSTMDGSETWLDNEAAMLGETTFTARDGSLLVSTTVKPTAQWVLHVSLALNGADVLADMSASIANVADGLAILATGDTHAQIAKNQFVYVRNHGTANGFSGTAVLADGLYVATAAINANGSLTTSNLVADGAGGLNALKADYDALSSNLDPLITSKTWTGYTYPTLENGTHYQTGCRYNKFGAFVHVYISVQFDSAPSNALLWTMPSGFVPIGDVQLAASGGGSYNAKAQAVVDSSGQVRVTSVDKWVQASGIYFVTT